jgi:hypothetical protein
MHRLRRPLSIFLVLGGALALASCNYVQMLSPPDDKAIAADIQAKLFVDPVLKARDIHVVSEKGVVVLTGTVATDLEKSAIERYAGQAKGVKQVINQLSVAPPAEAAAPVVTAEAATPAAPETPAPSAVTPAERPKTTKRSERAAPAPAAHEVPEAAEAPSTPAPSAPARPPEAATAPPPQPAPPQPEQVTIPAGTVITVRMIDSIDSSRNRPGEEFSATVDAPVVVDERVVIRRGADARVRLVEARSAGRMTGRSELQVELVGLAIGNQTYATQSGVVQKTGASRGTRTAATVGGGAALGTLIGAIAGKGKGAAIGAAVGAGAGTAVQASTKGQQVQVPAETKLDFTLKVPITVTM